MPDSIAEDDREMYIYIVTIGPNCGDVLHTTHTAVAEWFGDPQQWSPQNNNSGHHKITA